MGFKLPVADSQDAAKANIQLQVTFTLTNLAAMDVNEHDFYQTRVDARSQPQEHRPVIART